MGYGVISGFSVASASLIGFEIGARNPEEAKRIAKVTINIVFAFALFLVSLFYHLSPFLASLYSTDQEIQGKFVKISWAVLLAMFTDAMLGIHFSFIKALGQQKNATKYAIFSQLFFGIPSQPLFAFYF